MSFFFLRHPSEHDLALFAGGELGPLSRWRIERHLETCSNCQADVAGFFHLQDELSPLAELPEVDWNHMAEAIERRVAQEPAPQPAWPQRAWSEHAWSWQFGLAAACAAVIVAVAVRSPGTEVPAAPAEMVAALQTEAKQDIAQASASFEGGVESDQAFDNKTTLPVDRVSRAKKESSTEVRGNQKVAPEAPVSDLRLRAELSKRKLTPDQEAPAAPRRQAAAESFDLDDAVLLAEARRRDVGDEAAEANEAAEAVISRDLTPASTAVYREKSVIVARALPPLDAEARVGMDGWIEIRSVSDEGILTITEVYAQ